MGRDLGIGGIYPRGPSAGVETRSGIEFQPRMSGRSRGKPGTQAALRLGNILRRRGKGEARPGALPADCINPGDRTRQHLGHRGFGQRRRRGQGRRGVLCRRAPTP